MKRNSALRWQNKWRGVFIYVALIPLCFSLFACDQKPKSADAPSQPSWPQVLWGNMNNIPLSPDQAKQWFAREVAQVGAAQGLRELSPLNRQLQNLDRRLVRSVGLDERVSEQVFINVRTPVQDKKASTTREQMPRAQLPQGSVYDLGMDSSGVSNDSAQSTGVTVQTLPDLSQADANQIQYVGMMEAGAERFGLVRVGERVYRVVPNMRIGRGQWRVLQMDVAKMQVLINGQTVHYEK